MAKSESEVLQGQIKLFEYGFTCTMNGAEVNCFRNWKNQIFTCPEGKWVGGSLNDRHALLLSGRLL